MITKSIEMFSKNKSLINLIYADILLQNCICEITSKDIIIFVKERNELVKIKKIKEENISFSNVEYNTPMMPVSF